MRNTPPSKGYPLYRDFVCRKQLLSSGTEKAHRDSYHGRYAIALAWYATLTKNDVSGNCFSDFDEEISEREIEIAPMGVLRV